MPLLQMLTIYNLQIFIFLSVSHFQWLNFEIVKSYQHVFKNYEILTKSSQHNMSSMTNLKIIIFRRLD